MANFGRDKTSISSPNNYASEIRFRLLNDLHRKLILKKSSAQPPSPLEWCLARRRIFSMASLCSCEKHSDCLAGMKTWGAMEWRLLSSVVKKLLNTAASPSSSSSSTFVSSIFPLSLLLTSIPTAMLADRPWCNRFAFQGGEHLVHSNCAMDKH